jgi:hypothetical protein
MRCKNEAPEVHVKRIAIAFIAVLLTAAAVPAFALDATADRNANTRATSVVDEVIRMWKSNVPEEDIMAFVHKADRFSVSADDIIDMTDAKVPRTIIKAVLDEGDARGDGRYSYDRRSTVYVAPAPYYGYYGYYGRPYYDPWYYDPFWYGYPRFSVGIGLGFGHFRGGHFRHR